MQTQMFDHPIVPIPLQNSTKSQVTFPRSKKRVHQCELSNLPSFAVTLFRSRWEKTASLVVSDWILLLAKKPCKPTGLANILGPYDSKMTLQQ